MASTWHSLSLSRTPICGGCQCQLKRATPQGNPRPWWPAPEKTFAAPGLRTVKPLPSTRIARGNVNIWLYSVKNNSMRQLTHGAGGDFQPQWSPGGKQLVFFSSRARSVDIWSVEVTTGKRLTKSRFVDMNLFFSPDGRWIAFNQTKAGGWKSGS